MKIFEICQYLDSVFPLAYQEDYDNSGLLVGDPQNEVFGILICFDLTERIIDEAIAEKRNLIVSHHPLIFKGLKKINKTSASERIIIKAIKNDISIYAAHTNLDNSKNGINGYVANLLGLKNSKILSPVEDDLFKLIVFCPEDHAGNVRQSMFSAGSGNVGNYDSCSFNSEGFGTFRGNEAATPFVGNKNEIHFEKEQKIETIVPKYLLNSVLSAMIKAHPYEEVAYDLIPLKNLNIEVGAGIVGDLPKVLPVKEFMEILKSTLQLQIIRHNSSDLSQEIHRVAYSGGSGSFLIHSAFREKADIFISGDIKYHDFFDFQNRLLIADIGHFESERMVQDILFDVLTKKFPNFACSKANNSENPVHYL